MPIVDIQRGLREVGRIRCGDQVVKNGKSAPRKLDRFRFTSDDANLLHEVAGLYGGEVEKWPGAPIGDQWQVYSTKERIPVAIVPGLEVLSQWHELWSGGGCQRRCDGQTEQLTRQPCICLQEGDRQCKPTTRLSVILPEVPGVGVWRLESHGYYAARELGGQLALVDRVVRNGDVVLGYLRLTFREDRRPGQPIKRYSVPALEVNQTFAQLAATAGLDGATTRVVMPSTDGAASSTLEHLYQPNDAQIQAEAARAAMPTPESVAAAETAQQARHTATRAAKNAKPALGTGRTRNTTSIPPAADEKPKLAAPSQKARLFAICRDIGINEHDDRIRLTNQIVGRPHTSSNELTYTELGAVLDVLQAVKDGHRALMLNLEGQVTGVMSVDEPVDVALPIEPPPAQTPPPDPSLPL